MAAHDQSNKVDFDGDQAYAPSYGGRSEDKGPTMSRRTAWLLLPVTLISALGAAWYFWGRPTTVAAPQRPPPIIPVTTTLAQRQDVPVFLSGIGTVRAFNIVTVKTRVDGHLESVAFVEGQDVTEGDVLAQIDPRSFQAQLAQARAAKARNEALLANARLDYQRSSSLASRDFARYDQSNSLPVLDRRLKPVSCNYGGGRDLILATAGLVPALIPPQPCN